MGTTGYRRAADLTYEDGEVILEVGSGISTHFLAQLGQPLVTIDPAPQPWSTSSPYPPSHVDMIMGFSETVLRGWNRPIGFAWLDGWDFPYDGVDYTDQRAQYEARGQEYSQEASRRSHLTIAQRIVRYARMIAFDDTWRTHPFMTDGGLWCRVAVPPATMPAPALAMDTPLMRANCLLPLDHPHHSPDWGWDGKGGEAVPWLLEYGYRVVEYGLGLVVLEREDT
jgi:hypothetical protein